MNTHEDVGDDADLRFLRLDDWDDWSVEVEARHITISSACASDRELRWRAHGDVWREKIDALTICGVGGSILA